ncbi:MAG TPA: hypothetical protein VNV85_08845 [Puia sp.]|jgi:hypothetical protein|nr:hypothetical protein [Puia sp.]
MAASPFCWAKKDAEYFVGFMGVNQFKARQGKQIIKTTDVAIVKIFYVYLQSNLSMLSLYDANIKFG